jgi:hypothetical protein
LLRRPGARIHKLHQQSAGREDVMHRHAPIVVVYIPSEHGAGLQINMIGVLPPTIEVAPHGAATICDADAFYAGYSNAEYRALIGEFCMRAHILRTPGSPTGTRAIFVAIPAVKMTPGCPKLQIHRPANWPAGGSLTKNKP